MRSINRLFMALAILLGSVQLASAMGPTASKTIDPKRIALLIGNAEYAATVGPLANPGNDVALVASALQEIGFARRNIRTLTNANRVTILQAVDEYSNKVAAAGPGAIAFLYYSGHGAASQQDRRNYIIPTGVKALDRTVWYQAVALDDVVSQLASRAPSAAHFVIFDACRNLLKIPTKGTKGFVPMAEKSGMLIAFSTDPGETASDEGSGAGPYASALAAELVKPGQDHLDLFQNVKERVHRTTSGQRPWERNGLLKRVYLNDTPSSSSAPRASAQSDAATAWGSIKDSKDPDVLKSFAEKFRGTFFADLATRKLQKLSNSGNRSTATPDVFGLSTPKWKRVRGFDRLSRAEAIRVLKGNTIVTPTIRRYFASDNTYENWKFGASAGSGTWKIGQQGKLYMKPFCPAVMKYNPEFRKFQWQWQKPCEGTLTVRVVRGKHLTP